MERMKNGMWWVNLDLEPEPRTDIVEFEDDGHGTMWGLPESEANRGADETLRAAQGQPLGCSDYVADNLLQLVGGRPTGIYQPEEIEASNVMRNLLARGKLKMGN